MGPPVQHEGNLPKSRSVSTKTFVYPTMQCRRKVGKFHANSPESASDRKRPVSKKRKPRRGPTPPRTHPKTVEPGSVSMQEEISRSIQAALATQNTKSRSSPPVLGGYAGPAQSDSPFASVAPAVLAATSLDVTAFSCGTLQDTGPHALGLTYWFPAPERGDPTVLHVGFTGRRLNVEGPPKTGDEFVVTAEVPQVLPGSGRICVTSRVNDITPGQWEVTASPIASSGFGTQLAAAHSSGSTGFAPVIQVRAPGVRLGSWPALVLLGTVLALITQALLATSHHEPARRLLVITVLACLVGLVGAKSYYLLTHRGEPSSSVTVGMSVQGFVIALVGTLTAGSLLNGLDLGTALDLSAPGLLFGLWIGRIGCFFAGCCAGRPTASRWGLWSSNRNLGLRRIPVQLLESSFAALTGVGALVLVAYVDLPYPGMVFVGTLATYIFGRQLLFPLRDLPRATAYGRVMTMVTSAAVVLVDLAGVLAGKP
jgi:phosphatidylglycerol:prolipoprotein diacylglycerol transferase